ncbi:MAG: ornithine cyclodeaminase family protein [Clostridia bacterium]|nr:ornithine cyclodeaminase family protein [Clostridia bacterium]
MNNTLLLSKSDILEVLNMKDVVEICDKTFKGFGEGTTINPTKVTLDLGEEGEFPPYEGFMNAMPAYIGWCDSAGIKWVGGFLGERKKKGLPYIVGMILLIDPKMGDFVAAMDGAHITNWRTGAQTAIALKYLLPNKQSIKLGIYGAGMQARTNTIAISEVFDIEELRVYDIYKESGLKFKKDMKEVVNGEIIVVDEPKNAANTDAIISVTQSKDKFIKNEWVEPGTIYFPLGSYQECDDELILKADKIIVDHIGQALHRGALKKLNSDGKITEENIYATIGELAAAKKQCDVSENERVICIPIGTGAMDVAVATVVLDRAKEKGLGEKFSFTI